MTKIQEAIEITDKWLVDYQQIYPLQAELDSTVKNLDIWLVQWTRLYNAIKKKILYIN